MEPTLPIVKGDFAEELFGPDLSSGYGLHIGQLLAVARGKKPKNTPESSIVGEVVPFEKLTNRRVSPKDRKVADMLRAGKYAHDQHHDDISGAIYGSVSPPYIDVLIEHLAQPKLFCKAPQMYEPCVTGEVFFGKLDMKSTHISDAS